MSYEKTCLVNYKLLTPTAKPPKIPRAGDVGYDIFIDSIKENDSGTVTIHSGLAIHASPGWFFQLAPRSSIHKYGLIMCNSIGIIDEIYQGELIANFYRMPGFFLPKVGDRILQLIPRKYYTCQFKEVQEFATKTERADGGHGSTGK